MNNRQLYEELEPDRRLTFIGMLCCPIYKDLQKYKNYKSRATLWTEVIVKENKTSTKAV